MNLLGFVGKQPAAGAGTWPEAGKDKANILQDGRGRPLRYQPGFSNITLISGERCF